MPSKQSFRAPIKIRDGNPCVDISRARARALKPGWRRPIPVLVRINGEPSAKPWRINVMPTGIGAFYLYLHGDVRRASKTKVHDLVDVDVECDEAYRNGPMHPMPAWFRGPLEKNSKAAKAWEAQVAGGAREECRTRDPHVGGEEGPIHGPFLVKGSEDGYQGCAVGRDSSP